MLAWLAVLYIYADAGTANVEPCQHIDGGESGMMDNLLSTRLLKSERLRQADLENTMQGKGLDQFDPWAQQGRSKLFESLTVSLSAKDSKKKIAARKISLAVKSNTLKDADGNVRLTWDGKPKRKITNKNIKKHGIIPKVKDYWADPFYKPKRLKAGDIKRAIRDEQRERRFKFGGIQKAIKKKVWHPHMDPVKYKQTCKELMFKKMELTEMLKPRKERDLRIREMKRRRRKASLIGTTAVQRHKIMTEPTFEEKRFAKQKEKMKKRRRERRRKEKKSLQQLLDDSEEERQEQLSKQLQTQETQKTLEDYLEPSECDMEEEPQEIEEEREQEKENTMPDTHLRQMLNARFVQVAFTSLDIMVLMNIIAVCGILFAKLDVCRNPAVTIMEPLMDQA